MRLQELSAHYDECQRQLQIALDQYGMAQRKANSLQAELDEVRSACEAVSKLFFKNHRKLCLLYLLNILLILI